MPSPSSPGAPGHPPLVRLVYLMLLANAVPAVLSLGLAPGSEDLFAWVVEPDASARMLAVMYANAVVLVVLGLRAPDWAHTRAVFVLVAAFSVAATAVTLTHLGPFLQQPWFYLGYWLLNYGVLVWLAPAVLVAMERRAGGRLPCTRSLPGSVRVLGALAVVGLVAVACAILIDPAAMGGAWPWPLAPLAGRLFAVWLLTLGLAYAWALWDGDRERTRILFVQAPLTAVLLAIVPVLHAGEVTGTLTLYVALTGLLAAQGVAVLGKQRGRPAVAGLEARR